jgi:hypothetical protein
MKVHRGPMLLMSGPAVAVALILILLLRRADTRISVENAQRIEEGMTITDVEEILGPERDESEGRVIPDWRYAIIRSSTRPYTMRLWLRDRLVIAVIFHDRTGSVVSASWWQPEVREAPPPLWQRLFNVFEARDCEALTAGGRGWQSFGNIVRSPTKPPAELHVRGARPGLDSRMLQRQGRLGSAGHPPLLQT